MWEIPIVASKLLIAWLQILGYSCRWGRCTWRHRAFIFVFVDGTSTWGIKSIATNGFSWGLVWRSAKFTAWYSWFSALLAWCRAFINAFDFWLPIAQMSAHNLMWRVMSFDQGVLSHLQNSHERLDRMPNKLWPVVSDESNWMARMFLGSRRVCRISPFPMLLSHPVSALKTPTSALALAFLQLTPGTGGYLIFLLFVHIGVERINTSLDVLPFDKQLETKMTE